MEEILLFNNIFSGCRYVPYTVFTRGDRRGDRSRDRSLRRSHRVNKHATDRGDQSRDRSPRRSHRVNTPLVAKIQPDKVVRWCRDGDFWQFSASCTLSEPRAVHFRLHSKFALRPHHVWKYGRHPVCDR